MAATTPPTTTAPTTIAVIGLTGGFGGALARELAGRGHRVRALVRDVDRARTACAGLDTEVELRLGDAFAAGDVEALVNGADALVWGLNVPYAQWSKRLPGAAALAFDAAARHGTTVLFPGNVYGLGPDFSAPIAEDAPRGGTSRKGRLRNALEDDLRDATARGARAIILRAGDYFGARSPSSWFEFIVAKALDGGPIRWPGPAGVPHAWAYLPDLAHAAAELWERRSRLGAFEVFHFPGHVADREEVVAAIQAALGPPERPVKPMPWALFQLARPFVPFVRELFDVRHVWTRPVLLDGGRLASFLGDDLRHTPLRRAVAETLAAMMGPPATT